MKNTLDGVINAAESLGITLPEPTRAGLAAYSALLAKWNEAIRLVGQRDPDDWNEAHFLDCLTPLRLCDPDGTQPGIRWLDIGSGAGLPGLILAIARPAHGFTLLEANQKKARFLRTAIPALSLSNAEVLATRAEAAPKPDFDVVISRAVAEPEAWLRLARPWVRPGGRIIAMLGRELPTAEDLGRLGGSLGLTLEKIDKLVLPRAGARRALIAWTAASTAPD